MVLDGAATGADHDDDLLDAGGDCLFDGVLDDRPINQRYDFLGDRFGGRQEASSEAGSRQDGLSDARADEGVSCWLTRLSPGGPRFSWLNARRLRPRG
jgi:hypothetical protein